MNPTPFTPRLQSYRLFCSILTITFLSLGPTRLVMAADSADPEPLIYSIVNGRYQITRSVFGKDSIQFKIHNTLDYTLSLYWVDYSGRSVFYHNITANQTYSQQTYLTHPWVIKDANGNQIGDVLYPKNNETIDIDLSSVALSNLALKSDTITDNTPLLKSTSNTSPLELDIKNSLSEVILIYSINAEGNPVFSRSINSNEAVQIGTFTSTPWVITDIHGNQLGNVLVPVTNQTIDITPGWADASGS